ncbi:MAG: glycosyltransferase family 2 protein [Nitrospirae bacterium]|nr:glycosyltransferase family 2 protein [Nitrospirota bacterium]
MRRNADVPLVSIVLSFRNEEDVLPELVYRLTTVLEAQRVDHELIFVNDTSTDRSAEILRDRTTTDHRIKVINMARRCGVSECVLAGMTYAAGDAVVYMDADLQDPPEVIPKLIEAWRGGAEVVNTVRTIREGEPRYKLFLTKVAYRLIRSVSVEQRIESETGDFKLISRRVRDHLLSLKERHPYLRGLIPWIGYKQVSVEYERLARAGGVTHFSIFRYLLRDLATLNGPSGMLLRGITSFSILPLVLFLFLGAAVCTGALLALLVLGIGVLMGHPWPGSAGLALSLTFLGGIQLVGIGTLGLYLGRVYHDVRGRPAFIVESTINIDSSVAPSP